MINFELLFKMAENEIYRDQVRELSNYDLNRLIERVEKEPRDKIIEALKELDKRGALDGQGRDLLSRLKFKTISSLQAGEKVLPAFPRGPFMDPNITNDPALPRLYSRYAIRFFAILFSPFFAGIMLAINLSRLNKNKYITGLIIFSFAFSLLSFFISGRYPEQMTIITLIVNLIGSILLEEFFWNRHIGRDFKFQRQNVLPALLIGFGVSFLMLAIMSMA